MSLQLDIPGWRRLELKHLVLDLNGTLAVDGNPLGGVKSSLNRLSKTLECHLVTADTFGTAGDLFGPQIKIALIQPGSEDKQKLKLVQSLGADQVVALGNGANDLLMLQAAALGICILGPEGTFPPTLAAADVAVPGSLAALGLLEHPDRIKATLRR